MSLVSIKNCFVFQNMSNVIEVNFQLHPLSGGILCVFWLVHKEVNDIILCQHRTAEDAKDFIDVSIQVKRVLNDGSKAVCRDGSVNLYSNSILGVSPKSLDSKMLLDEFKILM